MSNSLRPAPVAVAAWILPRLSASQTVACLVPGGFEAYVRLLNPVNLPWPGSGTTTWAAISERLGLKIGEDTSWLNIEDTPGYIDEMGEPESGTIPIGMAVRLAEVLSSATRPGAETFAMMWPGYGGVPQSATNTLAVGPENEMCVLTGDLMAVASADLDRIPVHWWPADHSWYIGGDVYGRSVYIGAPRDVAALLLSEFEGFAVTRDIRVPFEP